MKKATTRQAAAIQRSSTKKTSGKRKLKNDRSREYLHGFDKKEQERLIHQARFLEPYVYRGIELEDTKRLLEVGCGVGAQSKILLRRFPDLHIDGVDFSEAQLQQAHHYLENEVREKRIQLYQQDALKLKMQDAGQYDAAFLCWFLEHVPDPLLVLKNVRKQLKPGATIYCTEVFNQTLFVEPYSPAYLQYWLEFNDYQWEIKGHPFIGAQLGHLLSEAGFSDVHVETRPLHFDSRNPEKRAAFIEFFNQILLSAADTLVEKKRVSPELLKEMQREVEKSKKAKDAVFYYSFIRATGRVP